MPISIMLVFENYVPSFSKKSRNYASTFYFQFRKNTSELTIQQAAKWQTLLPSLQPAPFHQCDNSL